VRFRRPVRPGDQLITEAVLVRTRGRFGKAHAISRVGGVVVAEGMLTYSLMSMAEMDPADGGAPVQREEAVGERG